MKSTSASVCRLNTQRCRQLTGSSKPVEDDRGGAGRCCSAAQVWLWMSAGGALILLPRGETSLSGPDPRVVPHSEILQLLAVYTPTVHPDSFADPETFQSGPTR